MLLGQIQQTQEKKERAVKRKLGRKYQAKAAEVTIAKKRKRVMDPSLPSSSSAWKVLSKVQMTRLEGQTIAAGQTKNRRQSPAKP